MAYSERPTLDAELREGLRRRVNEARRLQLAAASPTGEADSEQTYGEHSRRSGPRGEFLPWSLDDVAAGRVVWARPARLRVAGVTDDGIASIVARLMDVDLVADRGGIDRLLDAMTALPVTHPMAVAV